MPTDPLPFSEQQLHQFRAVAESFGVDAERYDRARPRYPEALIERVIAASPGLEFLDVGCGTGIGARQYRASGCTVLGVEPDARMAEVAERTGVEVEIGKSKIGTLKAVLSTRSSPGRPGTGSTQCWVPARRHGCYGHTGC